MTSEYKTITELWCQIAYECENLITNALSIFETHWDVQLFITTVSFIFFEYTCQYTMISVIMRNYDQNIFRFKKLSPK